MSKKAEQQDPVLGFFKKRWQDKALAAVIIIFIFLQLGLFSELKQLPGPLYGGDFYHSLGVINHLYYGGTIFENSQLLGEYPWTPPLYHGFVALFAKMTSLDTMHAVFYSNIVFTIIIGLLSYMLGNLLLRDRTLGLTFATFIVATQNTFYHYHAMRTISILFLVMMLFYSYHNRRWWSTALAGVSYGVVLLSHASASAAASVLIFLYFGYVTFLQYISFSDMRLTFGIKRFRDDLKQNIIYCSMVFGIGFILGLIFWYVPIFVFHLSTPNKMQEFTYLRVDTLFNQLKVGFGFIYSLFKYNLHNILSSLMTLFFTIGLLLILFFRKKTEEMKYLLFLFFASVIGYFHPIVTQNLFGFNLTPKTIGTFPVLAYQGIIAVLGFSLIVRMISRKAKSLQKYKQLIFSLFFVLILILGVAGYRNLKASSPFFKTGEQPLPSYLQEVQDWVIKNTNVMDVFISDNEDAFMLNALTGRKVLASRRSQSGMFVDVDQRYLDSAIILHGSDDAKREELLRKYKVKYLFWHAAWLRNEIQFNDKGEIVNIFDPLLLQDKDDYESILKNYNITYKKLHTWLDPALRSEDYEQYDALLVYPELNATHPWSDGLDKYLKLEKTFYYNGAEAAKIYKVVI